MSWELELWMTPGHILDVNLIQTMREPEEAFWQEGNHYFLTTLRRRGKGPVVHRCFRLDITASLQRFSIHSETSSDTRNVVCLSNQIPFMRIKQLLQEKARHISNLEGKMSILKTSEDETFFKCQVPKVCNLRTKERIVFFTGIYLVPLLPSDHRWKVSLIKYYTVELSTNLLPHQSVSLHGTNVSSDLIYGPWWNHS